MMWRRTISLQRRSRDVDGEQLAWHEHGDGVPVVFVHGIPTGPELWRHVIPRVDGARCLAFEMLGYADSIPSSGDHDISVAAQVARLLRWLDALAIDRAVLVGHDLGGGVVQIAAVTEPRRCAGLVLSNAVAYDSWPIPSVKVMRAAGSPSSGRRRGCSARCSQRSLDSATTTAGSARSRAMSTGHPMSGMARRRPSSVRFGRSHRRHARHREPTSERAGSRARRVGSGRQVPEAALRRTLACDLGARLTRLDGARHFVPEDHPDSLAAAINELVASLPEDGA